MSDTTKFYLSALTTAALIVLVLPWVFTGIEIYWRWVYGAMGVKP